MYSVSPSSKSLNLKVALGTAKHAINVWMREGVRTWNSAGPETLESWGLLPTSHTKKALLLQTDMQWVFSRKSTCVIIWDGYFFTKHFYLKNYWQIMITQTSVSVRHLIENEESEPITLRKSNWQYLLPMIKCEFWKTYLLLWAWQHPDT